MHRLQAKWTQAAFATVTYVSNTTRLYAKRVLCPPVTSEKVPVDVSHAPPLRSLLGPLRVLVRLLRVLVPVSLPLSLPVPAHPLRTFPPPRLLLA